ncbi:zinc-binding dehydrogenase [Pseudonocardia sp. Ae717_Ps2]|uniref:zinc-dependent alcohol dehydrogenase n=1 Tax=Pseudonocardia sp. Ae717_Ps2 TaxID=1885573 RepID=UPI0013010261|nr:alcohol dehydrogenase catalytic domain-containing protein [Pseudonocardia sp. Ae717_Ps2]
MTTAPRVIALQERQVPEPAAGEVLVRTVATGICGSDVHLFHGDHPYSNYPLVQGHETVGRIEQVGPGEAEGLVGSLVAVEPTAECRRCGECLRGAYNRCENLQVLGVQKAGSLAGYVVARTCKVHPVPHTESPAAWALAEPVAVAAHAVERSGTVAGDTVVVLGAGVIGLAIALCLQRRHPQSVILVEPSVERRARVDRLGLGMAVAPEDRDAALAGAAPSGADVVFEATGIPSVLSGAHGLARFGGRIVVVGQGAGDFTVPVIEMTRKELTLTGSRNSAGTFPLAIETLAARPDVLAELVTHRFAPDQVEAAYDELARPGSGALKVLVEFDA